MQTQVSKSMPLDVRLIENKGVESHVENEEENESEADEEADMGAAEVGAAATAAAQNRITGGGLGRGWVGSKEVPVAVSVVMEAVVLGVGHGLAVDLVEVLARGHWRAEALHACDVSRSFVVK